MKPHPDAASLVLSAPARPGPLRLCLTASLCLVVGGVLLTLAAGWELADTQYSILAGLAVPWLALFICAALAVVRQGVHWLELNTGSDIDGDGLVGDTAPLRIELVDGPAGHTTRILEVPGISEAQLKQFARAAVAGAPLAVNAWTGTRRPFSRDQYDALVRELLKAGLARDIGGNVGRVLTPAGRAVLRRIVET